METSTSYRKIKRDLDRLLPGTIVTTKQTIKIVKYEQLPLCFRNQFQNEFGLDASSSMQALDQDGSLTLPRYYEPDIGLHVDRVPIVGRMLAQHSVDIDNKKRTHLLLNVGEKSCFVTGEYLDFALIKDLGATICKPINQKAKRNNKGLVRRRMLQCNDRRNRAFGRFFAKLE